MEQYYTLGIILIMVISSTYQYVKLRRLSLRNIIADYSLRSSHVSLKWTSFILPALVLFAGLYRDVIIILVLCAAFLFISTIVEWLLKSKYKYDAFTIRNSILTVNDYNTKDFNLEELTKIDFQSFSDSFKLKFKGGRSLSIYRPSFQKESLATFLNIAIEKSLLAVVISDDAKTKINISMTSSV
jgi:hypothetical protein